MKRCHPIAVLVRVVGRGIVLCCALCKNVPANNTSPQRRRKKRGVRARADTFPWGRLDYLREDGEDGVCMAREEYGGGGMVTCGFMTLAKVKRIKLTRVDLDQSPMGCPEAHMP